jgi:hypothetical protein
MRLVEDVIHRAAIAAGLPQPHSDLHQCALPFAMLDQSAAVRSAVLIMWNDVSQSTDHASQRVSGPDALSKSVSGAAISENNGMKVRKKSPYPKMSVGV